MKDWKSEVCPFPLRHPKGDAGLRRIALLLNLSTLIGQLSSPFAR